jgi:hypothetical protein
MKKNLSDLKINYINDENKIIKSRPTVKVTNELVHSFLFTGS